MNTNEIIKRLKIMLSLENEDETKEEKMKSLVTLVDGTEVFVEGEMTPGAILYVVTESEEMLIAPEGLHETTDGMLITVGEAGEIISIEPKAVEASDDEEEEEEEMADDEKKEKMETVEVEVDEDVVEPTKELLEGMAEILKPFIEEIKDLGEEFKKIKARFEAMADEPATKKIKTKMTSTKEDLDEIERKIEVLKRIRKNKNNNK